jgi:hypothetical protein
MNGVSLSLTICYLWLAVIVIIAMVLLASSNTALSFSNGQRASYILGQIDFNSAGSFFATSSRSLGYISDLTFDSRGNLWVADIDENRVLEYTPPFTNGKAAAIVIGQKDFESNNRITPPTSSSLYYPRGLTFDSRGNLWVADSENSRVLEYTPPFTNGKAAAIVIGQKDFKSSKIVPVSASSLSYPAGLTFDSNGNLWVADSSNHRVLGFSLPCAVSRRSMILGEICISRGSFVTGQKADVVIGQRNFEENGANAYKGPYSRDAFTLDYPNKIKSIDGNLWVADSGNNRVLRFSPSCDSSVSIYDIISLCVAPGKFVTGQAADVVIGQPNFKLKYNIKFPTREILQYPYGLGFDSGGALWVADTYNNRVLGYYYTSPCISGFDIAACTDRVSPLLDIFAEVFPYLPDYLLNAAKSPDVVIGQTKFTKNISPSPPTASSLNLPTALTFDSKGNLWVTDDINNRVLGYAKSP